MFAKVAFYHPNFSIFTLMVTYIGTSTLAGYISQLYFNKSSIGGSIGGKRINHMLYVDDLSIVSLSSAGLKQLLTICDQYCAMHSITSNVKKSVCMFFRCSINKTCDITNIVLSGNIIDYMHKTKYLGVLYVLILKHPLMCVANQISFMHKSSHYYVTFVIVQTM